MSTDQTPALDRATEAYYAHVTDFPDEGGWACEAVGCDFRTAEFAADEWQQHRLTAAVSAALHDPDDPDWLPDVIAAAIRDFHADPTIPHFARHVADAVRVAILGADL